MYPRAACILVVCVLFGLVPVASGMQVNITPRVSLSEEYTDNVFESESDEQEDFITVVTPGATLEMLGQQAGLRLSYDLGYAFYNEYDENDAWRHDALLNTWFDLTRTLRLEINDHYLQTEEPYTETDIALLRSRDPQSRIDPTLRPSREPYWNNTFDTRLIKQFGPRDQAFVAYEFGMYEEDDPAASDSEHHTPSVGGTYWFLPRWALDTEMAYVWATFDAENDFDQFDGRLRLIREINPNLQGYLQYRHVYLNYSEQEEGDLTNDFQVYIPSVGVIYNVAQDLRTTLDVGYFHRAIEQDEDQSGFSLRGDATKTFQRGSLTLTLGTGYDQAYFGSETLGPSQYYEAGISGTYNLTQNLSAHGHAAYREDQYEDIEPERTDTTITTEAGLSAIVMPWLTISLDYRYRDVDSDDETGESYAENVVMLEALISAPTPYRLTD